MEKIVLIGCGGHAKSVIDSIEAQGVYEIVGFVAETLDDNFEYRGYKIVGTDADLVALYDRGIRNAFVCIGYMGKGSVRQELYNTLKNIGYVLPVIIDPSAILAKDVSVGEGTFVGKRVVVNSNADVGKMIILNTGAVVEHDCVIEDYTHVAVNSTICGNVRIGEGCLIGAGATVIQGLVIGSQVTIGAGSVINRDCPDGCSVVGVPGKRL